MTIRLTFLCAGATASSRTGAFPAPDEPLDRGGAQKVAGFSLPVDRWDQIVVSPGRAATETAIALGYRADAEPAVADMDFGDWSGRTFSDIEASAAGELMAWLANPTKAPPGGETMDEVKTRVGGWIDSRVGGSSTVLAISHPAVMRAAIAHILSIPIAATIQIDVAPLTTLDLSHHGRWRLQGLCGNKRLP